MIILNEEAVVILK